MKQSKNKLRSRIAILVFVTLVVLSGVGLSTTGNFRNPFAVLGQIGSSLSTSQTRSTPQRGNDEFRNGGSEIGGVLFNVWFLFATSAAIMCIQVGIEGVTKRSVTRKSRTEQMVTGTSANANDAIQ